MSRFRRSAAVSETPDSQALVSVSALGEVAAQLAKVHTPGEVIQKALDVVRKAFDMRYSSCWWLDAQTKTLLFRQESGEVGTRFREVTKQASFARGVGLAGRAWAEGRLVFAPDLADVHDCVRAPAARESGVQSAVAFPITVDGEIVGTMDFMADPGAAPDAARQQVLSTVGVLVSQALERCVERSRRAEMEADMGAMNQVLHAVTVAHSEEAAIKAALDSIRGEFGWEYGSFWAVDPAEKVLRYSIESGDAGEEFRAVTRKATFAEGVGLAGRTWKSRALVFEPDMGQVTDCVRAPAAQRAGVKAGVCLPITAGDVVVGTMDFFSTHSITLTADREAALRNTAFLVSNAVDRFRAAGRIETAGQELLSSITEVERNVLQASNVAAEAKSLTAEATRIVASLNTSSEEIGNVVKVITSIAEQTNLLALNATIEAARAGESGKGFAVVASEVKELARETATATEEVGQKVAAIQRDAASVVKALDGVAATVNEINEAQHIIGGVLTEQNAVTRSVLEG